MRLSSGKGDLGQSDGPVGRLSKANPFFVALGDMDELQACLAVCQLHCTEGEPSYRIISRTIGQLQQAMGFLFQRRGQETIKAWLRECEEDLDQLEPKLTLSGFSPPPFTNLGTQLNLARCVCRRAERALVTHNQEPKELVAFINRLGDLLFALSRQ